MGLRMVLTRVELDWVVIQLSAWNSLWTVLSEVTVTACHSESMGNNEASKPYGVSGPANKHLIPRTFLSAAAEDEVVAAL